MVKADLHLHTNLSDGFETPEQIVQLGLLQGLDTIAITDHDTTRGVERAITEAKKYKIRVIPGVEISTTKYHILGYGFDYKNAEFQEYLKNVEFIQRKHVETYCEELRKKGLDITIEEIANAHPNARLGKVNVIQTILGNPNLRKKAKQKFGLENTNIEYTQMYKLIFYDTLDTRKIKQEYKDPEPKEAIAKIIKAGGVPILAHPFKDIKDLTNLSEIDELLEYGLKGVEIQPRYKEKNTPIIEYVNKRNIIKTYGSDYHGPKFPNRLMLLESEVPNIKKFW